MAYDLAKVTANGNNLIAQILANKSSLSIDKIEISDTQLSSTTDISTMTSVPKVVQTVSANGFSKNSNTLIISTVVDNSSISADYKAWVFGIWGSDSQNGQSQLIAVITSTNSPDTIPAFSGSTPVSYTYKFNIGFSNASQIQFNMIDDAFATNDTVVHTTGDETIDGQKKFDTDPTDSAGNAYAKTVDVNQQLDKKVNVSDMRKPASDVAGIDEVNAKANTSAIDPSVMIKNTLTADDDVLTLGAGTYWAWGPIPKNYPTTSIPWGTVVVEINPITTDGQDGQNKIVEVTDVANNRVINTHSGSPAIWSGWQVPNAGIMASKSDLSTGLATKAGDSTVVHNSGDETIGGTKTFSNPIKGTIDGITYRYSAVGDDLDTSYMNDSVIFTGGNAVLHAPAGTDGTWAIIRNYNSNATNGAQSYYDTNHGVLYVRTRNSTSIYTSWIQVADDSKVAHLSGANNFDTTPTVNNNPLLLASSLPSDLARTSQQTNFTAGLQSGGVTVATSDDLKSVENSAWRSVKLSDDAQNMSFSTAFYQKNDNTKKFTLIVMGDPTGTKSIFSTPKLFFTDPDIKAFIGPLSDSGGSFGGIYRDNYNQANELEITLTINGNSLMFTTDFWGGTSDSDPSHFSDLVWCGYQKFTGTYE